MNLNELVTPSLVIDRPAMQRNIDRLAQRLAKHGVALRPHVKTSKSADVSAYLGAVDTTPITVSTLKEARYFFEHGWKDILYAVGIVPGKFDDIARLTHEGATMTVILDNEEAAAALNAYCREHDLSMGVLIEIDTDGHRSGVMPDDALLLRIADQLNAEPKPGSAHVSGVLTHAGESYNCRTTAEIVAMAEQERAGALHAAQRLRAAGYPAPVVSVGSTPTAHFAESYEGVTEVRAGVYVFFDLVMHGLGVCALDDIALSVLCTVIGHQKTKGWIITDAGWMAMSRDRGTQGQPVDQYYGVVCDVQGRPIPGLVMKSANQEHGIVTHRDDSAQTPMLPIGTRLRILPNHACATGAQFNQYAVVDNTPEVAATWPRINGWG